MTVNGGAGHGPVHRPERFEWVNSRGSASDDDRQSALWAAALLVCADRAACLSIQFALGRDEVQEYRVTLSSLPLVAQSGSHGLAVGCPVI